MCLHSLMIILSKRHLSIFKAKCAHIWLNKSQLTTPKSQYLLMCVEAHWLIIISRLLESVSLRLKEIPLSSFHLKIKTYIFKLEFLFFLLFNFIFEFLRLWNVWMQFSDMVYALLHFGPESFAINSEFSFYPKQFWPTKKNAFRGHFHDLKGSN